MKTLLILGAGAQGSALAGLLDREPQAERILCADRDLRAAETLARRLSKGEPRLIRAEDPRELARLAAGADIIVNCLPIQYNLPVMEAALEARADYQDLCMTEIGGLSPVESARKMLTEQNERFRERELLALTNTGSAPGLINLAVREAVEDMDSCESIEISVYEGLWSRKFVPFWWSPQVAFQDMAEDPIRFENGVHRTTEPFGNPVWMTFPGIDHPVRMVDHSHEEPVTMGLYAGTCLKGVKNVIFRYGGPHVEMAETLYRMGLLSREEREFRGMKYVPMDLILSHTPPAPKYREEIEDILRQGLVSREGAFQAVIRGVKGGRPGVSTISVQSPDLEEAFERSGISHEAYLTGQSAFIFTKMLVTGQVEQKGLVAPEALERGPREFFFREAEKLGITFTRIREEPLA